MADAPLNAQGASQTVAAGVPFTAVIATFNDADPNGSAADYTTTITWGDGDVTSGTVTPDRSTPGQFDVSGSHTYASAGPFAIMVAIHDQGTAQAIADGNIMAVAGAVNAQGISVAAVEGQAFSGVVATFTDVDTTVTPGAFAATIAWGDGSVSDGTVTADPQVPGQFEVIGAHTYANYGVEFSGVSITSAGVALAEAAGFVTVNDAPLAALGAKASATVGAPFNEIVATFRDANALSTVGDYTVTVTWDDGLVTAATVSADPDVPGQFDVVSGRTFATAGESAAIIVVSDHAGTGLPGPAGATATVRSSFNVRAATLFAQGISFTTTAATPFHGLVATFTADQNEGVSASSAADFTARITWGDGQTSSGTVTADSTVSGQFDVVGSNVYAREGAYPVNVTISEDSGASATGTSNAIVADAPLSIQATTINTTAGTEFKGVVATFSDADTGGTIADYSATITWDDGTTSSGAVVADAGSARAGSTSRATTSLPTPALSRPKSRSSTGRVELTATFASPLAVRPANSPSVARASGGRSRPPRAPPWSAS